MHQQDPSQEKKDGPSDPGEQLTVDACTEAPIEAREQPVITEKSSSWRHRRKKWSSRKSSKAASPSPRQLEEATEQEAELADQVKFQTQIAWGLVTFSATTIISTKATTFGRPPGQQRAAGGQAVHRVPVGFLFWWSIALWFTCLLFSMFIILVTTFLPMSRGLLIYAKRFNYLSLCVSVLGVAFWIFS